MARHIDTSRLLVMCDNYRVAPGLQLGVRRGRARHRQARSPAAPGRAGCYWDQLEHCLLLLLLLLIVRQVMMRNLACFVNHDDWDVAQWRMERLEADRRRRGAIGPSSTLAVTKALCVAVGALYEPLDEAAAEQDAEPREDELRVEEELAPVHQDQPLASASERPSAWSASKEEMK